jgi:hypothetical protein
LILNVGVNVTDPARQAPVIGSKADGGGYSFWRPGDSTCAVSAYVGAAIQVPRLLRPQPLTEEQRGVAALLAAGIAIEHVRIISLVDSRVAARCAASVLDDCRALAADDRR